MRPSKTSIRCSVVSDIRLHHHGTSWYDARQTVAQGHWTELLDTFDGLDVLARAHKSIAPIAAELRLPAGIAVDVVPMYDGLGGALRHSATLLRVVWKLTRRNRLFILREPGLLPMIAGLALRLLRKRFTVELLGDPAEAVRHSSARAAWLWAPIAGFLARHNCRRASAVLYMSQSLAQKYPSSPTALQAVISDVRLPNDMWVSPQPQRPGALTLVTVASMAQPYKGHEALLRAVAQLREGGLDVTLSLAGDGIERKRLERAAVTLGIRESVEFHGEVPWGPELFALLDRATLFVLPSLTEGLPKAMLEAMARGVPAIGSAVGGIPTILAEEACFAPGDEHAIAEAVRRIVTNPEALHRLAVQGYEVAQRFRPAILTERRRAFYRSVRDQATTA